MQDGKLKYLLGLFFGMSRNKKTLIAILADFAAIACSITMTMVLREHQLSSIFASDTLQYVFFSTVVSIGLFYVMGLYRTVLRSIGESAFFLIVACTFGSSVIWSMSYSIVADFDLRGTIILWTLLMLTVGLPRMLIRNIVSIVNKKGSRNVLIFGAGHAGRQLAHAIKLGFEYKIVGFIDQNVELQGTVINGYKVYSDNDIEWLVETRDVERVLLAIPSAPRSRRYQIIKSLEKLPITIKSVTSMADIVSGKAKLEELRDIDIEDILGREPVTPDGSLLRAHNTGKNILVTGAGGSIGSELARQLYQLKPSMLIMLDVSEYALYTIGQDLEKLSTEDSDTQLVPILGSVQNEKLLDSLFKKYNIHTVYHAAAYKHVPMVENNISQGFLNNVIGTWNVAKTCQKYTVEKMILVSTDKAVRPTNFMGASKRMAELVLQAMAQEYKDFHCGIVRFGNVLGSSGSVVPLFKEQIRLGGPITVTHPEVIRYFMTIPESAQLVIQAGAMGSSADVYVLDMGDPVKISDLAKEMVRLSGLTLVDEDTPDGDIEIEYTGLRPGEKLYEELLVGEDTSGTQHPRILSAREKFHSWSVMNRSIDQLKEHISNNNIDGIFELLQDLEIDFNQKYPISDPFYRKPVDTRSKIIQLPSGTDS